MDYSSIRDESHSEDLAGPSPWTSSPQHSKTAFSPRTSTDEPPSPSANRSWTSLPDRTLESSQDFGASEPRLSQATTTVENGHTEHQDFSPEQPPPQQYPPNMPPQSQHYSQQQPQPRVRQAQRYHGARQRSRHDVPIYRLQPRVNGIERPTRKDPIIRFDIHTNLPAYRTTQFRDVRRYHSEFEKLADHLISANPEAMVPALPPSSTPAGIGTDEDDARVRASMQRWMGVVCGNDVLMRDEEVVRFIEGDPGYSPVYKRSQPATGVRRKVIKQFAPPPDDTPELAESRPIIKRFYLGAMDAGQKVDKAVKARRHLGNAESTFGSSLASLTELEPHPGLKHCFRKLGRTIQTTGDLHAAQATTIATVFASPLHHHSADAFIAKETLTNRHILLRDLAAAQQATRSKLNATDRLRASSSVRRDKVDEAIAALDEARSHERHLAEKTARVTHNLVGERRAWFARTGAEVRGAVRELVVREIEAERRTLAVLEAVRPDVRGIDASGGLSRLGREATPSAKRAAMQSSQGPRGDAWSGVERRKGDGLDRSISGSLVGVRAEEGGSEDAGEEEGAGGVGRPGSARSGDSGGVGRAMKGRLGDDDEDRVDARNAASRLATSTF